MTRKTPKAGLSEIVTGHYDRDGRFIIDHVEKPKPRTALAILAGNPEGATGDWLALNDHDEAAMMRLVGLGFVTVHTERRGRARVWLHVKSYRITTTGREHHAKQPEPAAVRKTAQATIKRSKRRH